MALLFSPFGCLVKNFVGQRFGKVTYKYPNWKMIGNFVSFFFATAFANIGLCFLEVLGMLWCPLVDAFIVGLVEYLAIPVNTFPYKVSGENNRIVISNLTISNLGGPYQCYLDPLSTSV